MYENMLDRRVAEATCLKVCGHSLKFFGGSTSPAFRLCVRKGHATEGTFSCQACESSKSETWLRPGCHNLRNNAAKPPPAV